MNARNLTMSLIVLFAVAPAQAAPEPCATPEHRQFDFWLGDGRYTKT